MQIEIWADVVCPWCYIGKRRFESALARFEQRDTVRVSYRSFELSPTEPVGAARSLQEALAARLGRTLEDVGAMHARVAAIAAEDGLDYRFDQVRPANTFDAHRLVQHADTHGRGEPMVERLYRAYFTEGAAIDDRDTLVRLASDIGLPAGEAADALASTAHARAVRSDEALAARLGIGGVPFFAIDRRFGVSGAQPADTLLEALRAGREMGEAAAASAPGADR